MKAVCLQVGAANAPDVGNIAPDFTNIAPDVGNIAPDFTNIAPDIGKIGRVGGSNRQVDERNPSDVGNIARISGIVE